MDYQYRRCSKIVMISYYYVDFKDLIVRHGNIMPYNIQSWEQKLLAEDNLYLDNNGRGKIAAKKSLKKFLKENKIEMCPGCKKKMQYCNCVDLRNGFEWKGKIFKRL